MLLLTKYIFILLVKVYFIISNKNVFYGFSFS